MSDETTLHPCPFCGGEAKVLKDGFPYVVIECERCFCRTNCNVTEAEAVAAWNSRAERTCRIVMDGPLGTCSLCGDECFGDAHAARYCPNCGAKVIGG